MSVYLDVPSFPEIEGVENAWEFGSNLQPLGIDAVVFAHVGVREIVDSCHFVGFVSLIGQHGVYSNQGFAFRLLLVDTGGGGSEGQVVLFEVVQVFVDDDFGSTVKVCLEEIGSEDDVLAYVERALCGRAYLDDDRWHAIALGDVFACFGEGGVDGAFLTVCYGACEGVLDASCWLWGAEDAFEVSYFAVDEFRQ